MSTRFSFLIVALSSLLLGAFSFSQTPANPALQLSLSRNFGYSSGTGEIQGTFTMRAAGPADLQRVVFYVDDQVIGEATAPPFSLRFVTDSYPIGIHTLKATGETASGEQLQSNLLRLKFVTAGEGWQSAMRIVIPILGTVFLVIIASFVIPLLMGRRRQPVPMGQPRKYGVSGGTICTKCGRPFALHFLSLHIGMGKLERCPHCGRWGMVHSLPRDQLQAAEKAELAQAASPAQLSPTSSEEKSRKELDDSRYTEL